MKEELIQKLLDIGGCGAETEWAQGYDDGVNAAIDEVERYFKQPTLNENQQIMLEYLKKQFGKHEMFMKIIFNPIQRLLFDYLNDEVNTAFEQLDLKQEIQILEVFGQWVLEQEEE